MNAIVENYSHILKLFGFGGSLLISLFLVLIFRHQPKTLISLFNPSPRIQALGWTTCSLPVRFPRPRPILLPLTPPPLSSPSLLP